MEPGESVAKLVEELVGTWNRGDASEFAELFTPHADYVTGAGVWLHGRPAIAALLRAGEPPPRVRLEGPASVREHGAAASVVFRWATDAPSATPRRGVVTCVILKSGGRWRIDRLHNTDTT